jgi:hypothetical protein
VVRLALCLLLCVSACDSWHWKRHPPTKEHAGELIEAVSRQFRCPAEQLVVTPVGTTGADVTGCGSSTRLCWRQPARLWPRRWMECE